MHFASALPAPSSPSRNYLEQLVAAISQADLREAVAAIEAWGSPATRKHHQLYRTFVQAYLRSLNVERTGFPLLNVSRQAVDELVHRMARGAEDRNLSHPEFWDEAIQLLDSDPPATEDALVMIVTRLVNHIQQIVIDSQVQSDCQTRQQNFRPVGHSARGGDLGHLSWADVYPFWKAGTELPQRYGVLFNVRLSFQFEKGTSHATQAKLVENLTRKLKMQIDHWNGDPETTLHWVVAYEACENRFDVVRLLLSIPDMNAVSALSWLRSRFLVQSAKAHHLLMWQISSRAGCEPSVQLRFHWHSIRALSRILDPDVMEWSNYGTRLALVDLLQIPDRLRARCVKVPGQKRRGSSQSISRLSRDAGSRVTMAYLSAIKDRAWDHVDAGWELQEFRARRTEMARRHAALSQMTRNSSAKPQRRGKDFSSTLEDESGQMQIGFKADPKSWTRDWIGWWQPKQLKNVHLGEQDARRTKNALISDR